VLGCVIILVGFLTSIIFFKGFNNEGYSLLNHFVSELGIPSISPMAIAFNLGLIVGGALLLIFVYRVGIILKTRVGRIIGVVSALGAVLVGFFPAEDGLLIGHVIAAMTFFYGGSFLILFFSVMIFRKKELKVHRHFSIGGFLVFIIFIIFLLYTFSGTGFNGALTGSRPSFLLSPFLEWLAVLSLIFWLMSFAIYSYFHDLSVKK